ncbi:MAG: radical SAM protein [Nitrospinota bacterium]|nr:radical SAM protein [Nitrospinota bacterium]
MKARIKGLLIKSSPLYRAALAMAAFGRGFRGLIRGRRGAWDHILSTASMALGSSRIAGRPINVTLEPANVCNLRCPVCETGAGILGRAPGMMKLAEFALIMDKIADHTNTLMLYFMGETFLNRDAYRMISLAKEKGVPFVTTCTNGDLLDPEKLVESGVDEVSFQIGGMTQATHETYRVGGNLERTLDNLRETVRIRNERRPGMKVMCGMILMKHNEVEIGEFHSKMAEWGVDEAVIVDPCVRTVEQGRRMLPSDRSHWFYDPAAFESGLLVPKHKDPAGCPWLYYSLSILVNGDVVPCCRDATGGHVMGNLLLADFEEIWNGDAFRTFRSEVHNGANRPDICRLCSGYGVSRIM